MPLLVQHAALSQLHTHAEPSPPVACVELGRGDAGVDKEIAAVLLALTSMDIVTDVDESGAVTAGEVVVGTGL